jgi:hypothetical protein
MSAAVVMMMMLFVFAGAVIYYFVTLPEEGEECEGKDENGNYVIDDKGKCVLKSCKTGYYKSGEECLVNLSGSDCVPTGTKDPQGVYLTNQTGGCELASCIEGYEKKDNLCVLGCESNTFTTQTATFTCSNLNDFKPTGATWWGTFINDSIPVSSAEAVTKGWTHTFHVLSSSANTKKYIAMQKDGRFCKMIKFDITKSGNTCTYEVKDAGFTGSAEAPCTATTDTQVITQWNAKNPVATAGTAATDEGYGLKSLDYSIGSSCP